MALTGGSDADFFARYIHQGGKITAVSNARVKEHVSPHRVTLIWRLRRQMQSSANRVYTSRKLYPSKKVYISVLQEVLKRLIHGSIRTLTSPLWLIAGYYPFKKSLYHGLRHYAKAIGLTCALFNLKKHIELYRTTDGY
ncbi:MAG: hypothetical protein Q7U33_04825 [Methylotenera sp.]|uniref:hypothetical protein n=1 Tax=Methylotenera sp. TaxID=2051956 RepID=UPI00271D6E3F|nr:hypothetical protein [Methylotenera sp.]MDO9150685.1 hypothetical protein [Methylotenera sp.]